MQYAELHKLLTMELQNSTKILTLQQQYPAEVYKYTSIMRMVILLGRDKNSVAAAFGLVGTIGLNMVATIVVGLLLGNWLDDTLATKPWLSLAGIVSGILSGFWSAYKLIMRYTENK